jgi:uncharacterized protein
VQFDSFSIVLLYRNPDAPELTDEQGDALQDAHLDHLASLHEAGHLLAAGPTAAGNPDEELRGVSILNVDPERARELKEADPAVRAGIFTLKILPWMVPAGAIRHTPTRFPHSIADVRGD